jgi:hypothetical protein
MRTVLLTIVALASAAAQSTDQLAIERARTTLVYTFDKSLPKVTLEDFLNQATKNGAVSWEANDCGEQSGDPEVDSQRDVPICAQATLKAANGRTAYVSVAVGTVHKGVTGRPELYDVLIVQRDQSSDSIQLRDLPVELNRPE